MSTHPNAMLIVALTPDDLPMKTYREIKKYAGIKDDGDIKINGCDYHHSVMESDYNESYQISGNEGDIILFDFVTYGYGELIEWNKLEIQKTHLEEWAKIICKEFHCSYEIFVSANYW